MDTLKTIAVLTLLPAIAIIAIVAMPFAKLTDDERREAFGFNRYKPIDK